MDEWVETKRYDCLKQDQKNMYCQRLVEK